MTLLEKEINSKWKITIRLENNELKVFPMKKGAFGYYYVALEETPKTIQQKSKTILKQVEANKEDYMPKLSVGQKWVFDKYGVTIEVVDVDGTWVMFKTTLTDENGEYGGYYEDWEQLETGIDGKRFYRVRGHYIYV